MTRVGEFLREIVLDLLSSGPVYIALTLALTAVWLLARLYTTRKRLSFQEILNSKIGIVPFQIAQSDDPATRILSVFNNVSVVVIRVRNSGRATIMADDFRQPLRFVVRGRYIVDFRMSRPDPPELRNGVDTTWFVSAIVEDEGDPPPRPETQKGLRGKLPSSLLSEDEGGRRRRRRKTCAS